MEPVIIIATGGSGGHVIPAETLAKKLSEQKCSVEILGHNVEKNAFFSCGSIKRKNVVSAPLSLKNLVSFVFKTSRGFILAISYFKKIKPSCVVGFGSYHSFPVLCAAFFLKIPIVLYEANTVMGKVVKLFSKKAALVASPFDFYKELKNFIQVQPLIKWSHSHCAEDKCYQDYSFEHDKKVLLILGGSQGAQFLNSQGLMHIMPSLDPLKWQVLHLAGHKSKLDDIEMFYEKYGIKVCVKPYENNMQKAYAISDLVISRSGATTLFELAHYKKPALLVPFPKASEDHQLLNADYYVKHYPAAVIEEFLLDKIDIQAIFERLITDKSLFKDEAYFINHTTLDKKVLELCLKK